MSFSFLYAHGSEKVVTKIVLLCQISGNYRSVLIQKKCILNGIMLSLHIQADTAWTLDRNLT